MSKTIASDKFHRIENNHGNHTVECEFNGEHHMTNRADALRFARDELGHEWAIRAYVGMAYRRRFDGHPATYRRYAIVRVA